MPNRDTPPRLVEAWLDFHREELCLNLDAVFAFDGQGMEIWCRSEENRDYRKLQKIIEPLRNSYDVELYTTQPPKDNNEDDKIALTDIPPSLVENRELRSYMRPYTGPGNPPRIIIVTDEEGGTYTRVLPDTPNVLAANAAAADRVLRARLVIWIKSVTRNSRIMRQYAVDIPELLRVAFEPAFGAVLRGRARDICRKHAKDLLKSIQNLKKNLARAFPKPPAKTVENKKAKKEPPAALPAVIEKADGIAGEAQVLSGRIYRFIYPAQHTVDLDELKKPGLLASLDAFEAEARDFQQALANFRAS
ncbi:MAG: hypothetical protein FWF13_03170 [Acidobacteria bacterium]|nr:hypothetical protein [Acidobacteriota bacterium]